MNYITEVLYARELNFIFCKYIFCNIGSLVAQFIGAILAQYIPNV